MFVLRLLHKKSICTLALIALSMTLQAYYVQLEQISTKEGLNFQEISTIENNSDRSVWVGTSVGFNIISNGNITPYSAIIVDGSPRAIGKVNDIVCYSNSGSLIASENMLADFSMNDKSFITLKYANRDLITGSLEICDDFAVFYDKHFNALFSYHFKTGIVSLLHQFDESIHFPFLKILKTKSDSNLILLISDNAGVYRYNLKNDQLDYLNIGTNIRANSSLVDSDNNLWLVSEIGDVCSYNIDAGYRKTATYNKNNSDLKTEDVTCLAELPSGVICVGTDGNGLFMIRKSTGEVEYKTSPLFEESTSMCLIGKDLAFGTLFNGLVIARHGSTHMLNSYNINDKNNLSNNVALSAYDEGNGIVWIGTSGGGINRYDEKADESTSYPSTKILRVNSITGFDVNRLLIGTLHKGYKLFDKRDGLISNNFMDIFKSLPYDFQNDSIRIIPDNQGRYLLFNVEGRDFRYDPESGKIELFQLSPNNKTGVTENVLKVSVFKDYAVTSSDRTINIIDFKNLSCKQICTTNSDYTVFTVDSKGVVWFIDSDKLMRYDPEAELVTEEASTSNAESFVTLTSDADDNIWLSSAGGLIYKYNQNYRNYSIFSREDDIPEGNFLKSFALFSSTKRLYFPNASGLLVIDTNDLTPRQQIDRNIECVSMMVDEKSIENPIDGKIVLPCDYKSFEMEMMINSSDPTIPTIMKINLLKDGNVISSKVSSNLKYGNTMLKSGSYELMVQTLDPSGWSEPHRVLELKVKAPLLLTGPVLTLLIALLAFGIWLTINSRYIYKQRKLEQLLFDEASKQKESRIAFMTNIAHELRTPLSLVYNPLKDIILEKTIEGSDYERLNRIFKQIGKMTNLVNMILDSSSIGDASIKDRIETININEWLPQKMIEFQEEVDRKGLEMKFDPCVTVDSINLDREVFETAINNVVSNAIKYSDSGIISISVIASQNLLKVSISDQGRGFQCPAEDLFKRFFRETTDVVGYGLGLSYTKTILQNIGGSIEAVHNQDIGSTFIIEIPFETSGETSISSYIKKENEEVVDNTASDSNTFNTKDKVLLFVDDDLDLREYIKREYASLFRVVMIAKNGEVALEMMKNKLPDIVVSDIMMPNLNGFDLCKSIKSNLEFSHLPVILLTSRSDSSVRMTSYKLGADAFLPKPFDFKELYKIIKNLLWNRYEIKRQYSQSSFSVLSEEQTFSAADEQFVLRLNKFITANINNIDLDIEMISNHMNISRSTLFNKMNDLLGTSAVKYIRRLRIDAAKKLLENTDKSILDVAIECGFSDSQYLSSVFKQETSETPSQYRKRAKMEKVA